MFTIFKNRNTIFIVIVIFLLMVFGGFIRFYNNTHNPNGLNVDEVAFGYNAYSILKTARDENGLFMPLSFRSYGDYKNPIPLYLMVPSIALFGLNDFAVRFPNALLATLSIPIFYLLFYKLTKKQSVSLIAILLLTISPWHIFFSRFASENLIGCLFVVLGMYFFLKMIEKNSIKFSILSSLFLIGSMYTYFAQRLFIPLFYLPLIYISWKKFKLSKSLLFFVIVAVILALPLILSTLFGSDNARAKMTFIGNDIEFLRNVALTNQQVNYSVFNGVDYYFLLFFYWFRKYLNYIHPAFLFFKGLDMTTTGSLGLGVLYFFEAPFLIFGIFKLIKQKLPYAYFIIYWILIGLIPASLTISEQNATRTLLILPPLLLISSLGAMGLFKLVRNNLSRRYSTVVSSLFALFILWNLIRAYFTFAVHFPNERGEYFMEGSREVVNFIEKNQNRYKEVVFDPVRGVDGPLIVSVPHMYMLFYLKYDPITYQNESKLIGDNLFGFGKYRVRRIKWEQDKSTKDILYIGSPWSIPEESLKPGEILDKIYLTNGKLAYLIVSPK